MSAADEVLPTIFRQITGIPSDCTARIAAVISPLMIDPTITRIDARGRADGQPPRPRGRKIFLANQLDGIHRNPIATDIVAVGFVNRAHRHLRTATHKMITRLSKMVRNVSCMVISRIPGMRPRADTSSCTCSQTSISPDQYTNSLRQNRWLLSPAGLRQCLRCTRHTPNRYPAEFRPDSERRC